MYKLENMNNSLVQRKKKGHAINICAVNKHNNYGLKLKIFDGMPDWMWSGALFILNIDNGFK